MLASKGVFFAPLIDVFNSRFRVSFIIISILLTVADNGISSSVSLFLLSSMDILGNMLISSSLSSKDNSDKSETFPSVTKSIESSRLTFFLYIVIFLISIVVVSGTEW